MNTLTELFLAFERAEDSSRDFQEQLSASYAVVERDRANCSAARSECAQRREAFIDALKAADERLKGGEE